MLNQMVLTTTHFVRVIATIVLAVTTELLAYALEILTSELLGAALLVLRVAEIALVATVAAIIVMIAQPAAIQASAIVAGELIVGARSRRRAMMQGDILVSSVDAIRIAVAQPFLRNALSAVPYFVLGTGEFGFLVAFSVVWKFS